MVFTHLWKLNLGHEQSALWLVFEVYAHHSIAQHRAISPFNSFCSNVAKTSCTFFVVRLSDRTLNYKNQSQQSSASWGRGALGDSGPSGCKGDYQFNPGGRGTPLYGLDGDVPLDRAWFFTSLCYGLLAGYIISCASVLNSVYNFVWVCQKGIAWIWSIWFARWICVCTPSLQKQWL